MVKKIVKWVLIVILAVLIMLITLPFVFQGAIVDRIKHEVNEQLDARVDFGRYRLSLLRSFPDASLRLDDILVENETPFEGDTLASIGRLRVTIDLRSLFGDGFEIKHIQLNEPDLRFRLLEDGSANWDIVPMPEKDPDEEPDMPSELSDFSLALRSVDIRDACIKYHDDVFLTYVDVKGLTGRLRGDLTMDVTHVRTRNARIDAFSLRYDRMPILSNVGVDLTAEVEMDLRDWVFTFYENEINLNALPLTFDGVISIPEGGGTMMDFSFAAARSDFAAFLSLIPAVYASDFADLESAGSLALQGQVNGLLKGEQIPGFDLMLKVEDGMFSYPDMPDAVRDVHIDALIANRGNTMDDVLVDLSAFRLNMAGNPLEARFAMRNPISDPWIDAALHASLDLGEVMRFIPMEEEMLLEGNIDSQLEARGRLSTLEKGDYQRFHATGHLSASGIRADAPMLPAPFEMEQLETNFSPQHLAVERMRAGMADNVMEVSGHIDNILQYAFDGDVLRGNLDITAEYLNINEFMPDMPESREMQARREETPDLQAVRAETPAQLSVIRVPPNIDFSLDTRIGQLIFDDMDIKNLRGGIRVLEQQALLDRLSMKLLGGSLAIDGSYDTRMKDPEMALALDLTGFDIQETFNTFNTMEVLAPVGEYASGSISGGLTMNATLDQTMQPRLETLSGNGNIQTRNVIVQNLPTLVRLADRLQMDHFREIDVGDVALRFTFADGKVETEPFGFTFGRSEATISGTTWFDQRIDYVMRLGIPHDQFGTRANQVLDNLVSDAAERGFDIDPGERVEIDALVTGTVTEPELSLDMSGTIDDVRDQIRDEVDRFLEDTEERIRDEVDDARDRAEEEVRDRVDETRDRVDEELEQRAQQVIAEAERQAENIRNEAGRAADRIRSEAQEQADRLVEEADGPIARAAARRAADSLVNEANRRADQLEEEADKRAQQVLDEAHTRAERILEGEE